MTQQLPWPQPPLGVANVSVLIPKVAAARQPWALGRGPLGAHQAVSLADNLHQDPLLPSPIGDSSSAETPTAFHRKAQGWREARAPTLGNRRNENINPAGVEAPGSAQRILVPQVAFIPFRVMLAQQSAQFVLETHL